LPIYYGVETFEGFSIPSNMNLRSLYFSSAVADVNNDFFNDIIFKSGSQSFIIYINNSDGSFATPQLIQFESSINSISSFEISDINSDGIMDILVSHNNNNDQGFLRVKYGLGNLEFSESEILIFSENARIEDFATVDIDQDGELEILLSAFTSQATFDDSLNHGLKLFKRQFDEFTEAYTFAQSNPPRIFVLSQAATELNRLKIYTNDATHKTVFGQINELRSEVSQHVLTKRDIVTKSHLESLNLENDLIIYPNPAKGVFNLEMKNVDDALYTIRVTDLSGRILILKKVDVKGKHYAEQLNLQEFSNGIYFCNVFSDNLHENNTFKLVITK
jgi:hypothetical protein